MVKYSNTIKIIATVPDNMTQKKAWIVGNRCHYAFKGRGDVEVRTESGKILFTSTLCCRFDKCTITPVDEDGKEVYGDGELKRIEDTIDAQIKHGLWDGSIWKDNTDG